MNTYKVYEVITDNAGEQRVLRGETIAPSESKACSNVRFNGRSEEKSNGGFSDWRDERGRLHSYEAVLIGVAEEVTYLASEIATMILESEANPITNRKTAIGYVDRAVIDLEIQPVNNVKRNRRYSEADTRKIINFIENPPKKEPKQIEFDSLECPNSFNPKIKDFTMVHLFHNVMVENNIKKQVDTIAFLLDFYINNKFYNTTKNTDFIPEATPVDEPEGDEVTLDLDSIYDFVDWSVLLGVSKTDLALYCVVRGVEKLNHMTPQELIELKEGLKE